MCGLFYLLTSRSIYRLFVVCRRIGVLSTTDKQEFFTMFYYNFVRDFVQMGVEGHGVFMFDLVYLADGS